VRFDVGLVSFSRHEFAYTPPCIAPGCSGGGPGPGNAITAASATASVVLAEHPGQNTFYWIAGLGAYDVTKSARDGSYRRFGWNVGGGFNLGRNAVFELRYHGLVDPKTSRAFIPITFGFRF